MSEPENITQKIIRKLLLNAEYKFRPLAHIDGIGLPNITQRMSVRAIDLYSLANEYEILYGDGESEEFSDIWDLTNENPVV